MKGSKTMIEKMKQVVRECADLKGITVDQAMMVCLVQKALIGDLNAISTIRDTIGEKPAEKVDAYKKFENFTVK